MKSIKLDFEAVEDDLAKNTQALESFHVSE
jgi:hypothetical protein